MSDTMPNSWPCKHVPNASQLADATAANNEAARVADAIAASVAK
jgi:hypothetical protein